MKHIRKPSLDLFVSGPLRRLGLGHWTARVLGLAMLAGFLVLRAGDPVPVKVLRLKVFDLYQLVQPRQVDDYPVIIVDLDEDSLAAFGQWPWPRDLLSDLVRRIFEGGTTALAFDIVFAEPDRLSPKQLAENMEELDDRTRSALRKLPDHDVLLAQMLRATRVVAGEVSYKTAIRRRHEPVAKASFATLGGDPRPFLPRFESLVGNIPLLEEAAQGLGVFTFEPVVDGIVRRVPTMIVVADTIRPSLSLELLRVATGQTTYAIKSDKAGVRSVVVAGVEIPTDRNGRLWVHYSHRDPKRYLSAKDVLLGHVSRERLAGKLVLIGTSAIGLQDMKSTPLNETMPGVEIHAQLIETILTGNNLLRPHYALGAELVLAAVVGLVVILVIPILGALWTLLLGGVIALAVAGGSWYLYTERLFLIDVSYALLSSFVIYALLSFLNYLREEQRRQQVRGAFSQYLSPALVEQLADHPERLKLGGETREMSFLFCDVRGFTTISERLKANPQDLTRLINRLLTPLTDVILDQGGTIDKYMGDCVMAFWNAPIDDPNHATHACETALAMIDALGAVNQELVAEAATDAQALLPICVGIGINTGRCVVGNMGSAQRFDYTVLGDAVNMASRLEGQTKTYGVDMIVGAETAKAAAASFALLELDLVRVAGKTEPERIFALLGDRDRALDAGFKALQGVHKSMLDRYRMQDWPGAQAALAEARTCDRDPVFAKLYDLYEARIDQFLVNPPAPNWDGVTIALTK